MGVMDARGAEIYALLQHVRPIVLDSARVVEPLAREVGWTLASRAVVEVLMADGPATVPRIAATLSLARQNVQRQVDELIRLGHAEPEPNPSHRRSVLIRLTPRGRAAFDRLHGRELRQLAALLPSIADADLSTAAAVLASLAADIRERARASRSDE